MWRTALAQSPSGTNVTFLKTWVKKQTGFHLLSSASAVPWLENPSARHREVLHRHCSPGF